MKISYEMKYYKSRAPALKNTNGITKTQLNNKIQYNI